MVGKEDCHPEHPWSHRLVLVGDTNYQCTDSTPYSHSWYRFDQRNPSAYFTAYIPFGNAI